jgi:CRP-like cAMP-binding protein
MTVREIPSTHPAAALAALDAIPWATRLDERERAYLGRILSHRISYPAEHELLRTGAKLETPLILRDGWVGRVVAMRDGRRQILDFYLPGDLVGYCSREGARAKATYLALTEVQVSPAAPLCACADQPHKYPHLLAALRACEDDIESRVFSQTVRLGRQTAIEKMASLFVELHDRFKICGQLQGRKFALSLTQDQLGDILGLSVVHVNRTLQQLRRDGLIASDGSTMEIRAIRELAELAGTDLS